MDGVAVLNLVWWFFSLPPLSKFSLREAQIHYELHKEVVSCKGRRCFNWELGVLFGLSACG